MNAPALGPFVDQLRAEAFAIGAPSSDRERMGAEVELIPVDAESGRIAPIESGQTPATLPVLRALSRRLGWHERSSAKAGVPEWRTPSGGRISFEPGGQIEYAAPPVESVSELAADLRGVSTALREWLEPAGIMLLSVGVDPLNDVEDVPLRLTADRYRRMDSHFASIGPNGARMMRQTASIQICVDAGERPLERWRLLNALTPYLVAIFANSAIYAGEATGHQSVRRHIWGALDPDRTGIAYGGDDPVLAYAEFAMRASAILLGDESRRCVPFHQHLRSGTPGLEEWRAHLTTLFPEVRPRGYFEVRSTDALDPDWYAVPLVFLAGLTLDSRAARAAAEIVGAPDVALLVRAGRCGLSDAGIATAARQLVPLALEACSSLGGRIVDERDLDLANAFFDRYTRRRRSPAADALESAAV